MPSDVRILVVAATVHELAAAEPDGPHFIRCCCGVGPVDAAAATSRALVEHRPTHVLHVGIAGARRTAGLNAGTVVIGVRSQYEDLGVDERFAPSLLMPDTQLLDIAHATLPDAPLLTIGTTGRVGGTQRCEVEAMEGFAVLRAAAMAGVPALEVRVISNDIEESDRTKWHFATAFAVTRSTTTTLVRAIVSHASRTS